jgi:hypothetical protein
MAQVVVETIDCLDGGGGAVALAHGRAPYSVIRRAGKRFAPAPSRRSLPQGQSCRPGRLPQVFMQVSRLAFAR